MVIVGVTLTQKSSKSKVTYFDDSILTDQDVLRLDISVDHTVLVAVVHTLKCLPHYLLQRHFLKAMKLIVGQSMNRMSRFESIVAIAGEFQR